MTDDRKTLALKLAELDIYVFPVLVAPKADNPHRTTKKPLTKNGFLDASNDPEQVEKWWDETPEAWPGVAMGKSGLLAVDFDVHKDSDGNIQVDGIENFSELWLDIPETFLFDSVSGAGGQQYVFKAPAGKQLGPSQNYRGVEGLDTRAGGSYSVFTAAPESRDEFAEAPEWACDERPERDLSLFDGDSRAWFDLLIPGEPSLAVRSAIQNIQQKYTEQGNDLTHEDIVNYQHHAVRLGAEGHPGVEKYLEVLKDLTLSREGEHSRNPDEYEHEFAEALASGIAKYGGAVQILADLPDFELAKVPHDVPERLVTGEPGDNATFSELLRVLTLAQEDDLEVLTVLWNAPTTRNLAREWGLEFCLDRIRQSRANPEPEGENPILKARSMDTTTTAFLSHEDKEFVRQHPTFIDLYLESAAKKGFLHEDYAVPAAWSLLSAAFGRRALIPMSKPFGLNLWFLCLGPSGTGKSSEDALLSNSLDLLLKDGETGYNLGANSSPEAMHETLLDRDGKASMIHHDEASDFFDNLRRKDWMSGVKDQLSKWYEGKVDPVNKVRLKELKGKSARTSFGIYMLATPDRLLSLVDTSMFETGFLARFNWTWAPDRDEHDESRFLVTRSEVTQEGINPEAYRLVSDLLYAAKSVKPGTAMDWTDDAEDRLVKAHMHMDRVARKRDRYSATEPAVTRLKETMWKCAALLALWRGEDVIREIDAMTAIMYAEKWFNNLFKVVDAAGIGEFNQGVDEIESFIASKDGVTQAVIYTRFRSMIQKSPREIEDRLMFLISSNRVLKKEGKFYVNGTK